MAKGKYVAMTSIAFDNRVSDRNNVGRMSVITSQEQFRHFANEEAPLLGRARIEKCPGKDATVLFRLVICLFIH